MLLKFTVSGFKTIRKAELEFGRVNMFIGGNGAGKSNVLEALGVFSAGLKDISDTELQKRGVRLSVPTLFKSAFRNTTLRSTFGLFGTFDNKVTYKMSVKAGQNVEGLRFFSENITYRGKSLMGRSQAGIRVEGISKQKRDIDPARGLWDRFREAVDIPDAMQHELERMARYAIYAPQTAFLRGTEVESLPLQPVGLQGGNLAQAAQAVLRQISSLRRGSKERDLYEKVVSLTRVPGWSKSFVVQTLDPDITTRLVKTGTSSLYFLDRFMIENRNVLSAYDSSEGTLYLLFMAVLLLHRGTPKIFALDNVDNALNPSLTKLLLETLISCTCAVTNRELGIGPDQIFLTSHNPTSLDAFDIFDNDQRIFVVSRDEVGATELRRLEPSPGISRADWIQSTAGKKLSELWIEGIIQGALGGAL